MALNIITGIFFFLVGCVLGRLLIIFICIIYNIYRVYSKFHRLYMNAKDDRMRRDLFIDYSKMDKSIPVDILYLAIQLNKDIYCDELLSKEMSYFLYEY